MNIDEIITALREQGFYLELVSTVRDAQAMYSARFVLEDCEECVECSNSIPNTWETLNMLILLRK